MRASGKNCKTKNVSKSLIGVVVLGEHNEEKKAKEDAKAEEKRLKDEEEKAK